MKSAHRRIVSLCPVPVDGESRTLKLAASFERLGYESIVVENAPSRDRGPYPFTLITLSGVPRSPVDTAVSDAPRQMAITRRLWHALPRQARERLYFAGFSALYRLWRPVIAARHLPRADLYVFRDYRLFPLARAAARRAGAKLVYDAQDFYPDVYETASLSPFWRRRFLPAIRRLDGEAARTADRVLTVNDGIARLIEKAYGVAPVVFDNSHDERLDRALPVDATLRRRIGLGQDDFLLVAVGHAKEALALDSVAAAVAAAGPCVHLALLGRGTARFAEGRDRVHAFAPVPAREIVPVLAGADAAIIAYRPLTDDYVNSLPTKLFQAVAAGLPLLYPDLPLIRALAERHGLGLMVDPADPTSVTAALGRLADDAELRRRFAAAARRAHETLAWRNHEDRLGEFLDSIFDRPVQVALAADADGDGNGNGYSAAGTRSSESVRMVRTLK